MLKRGFKFFLIVASVAYIFSCTDNSTRDYEVDFYETFDRWAEKYYGHLEKSEDYDGIYWKFYRNEDGNTEEVTDSSIVSIEMSATLPDGTYVINTDPVLARYLNTFSYLTRYVPFEFDMYYYYNYAGVSAAQYLALLDMSPGDEVEILVANNGYGFYQSTTMYLGFTGESSISSATTYIKMKLISTALPSEKATAQDEEIAQYAADSSLTTSLYDGKIRMKWLVRNENEADTLHTDSSLLLNYTGKFTDGFVFDSNIMDIAIENNIYSSSNSYESISYNYDRQDTTDFGGGASSTTYIEAFKYVLDEMRLGDKVQFITSSDYAYGDYGSYETSGTLLYGYTPLIFTLEIVQDED